MKAAILHAVNQPLTIEEIDVDRPMAREVLVRTVAAGVCHSDLPYYEGRFNTPTPAVLGHEAAGIVEAVGELVTYVKAGDHVIACLSVFCGHCDQCLKGRPNLCVNPETRRSAADRPKLSWRGSSVVQGFQVGAYAEKMLLHENALVKIREDFPLDQAALIGCSVTTGVGAVLNTAKVEPGATVAVFGTGGVGLAAIQGASIAAASKIIAVDLSESRLAIARELGATHVVDASSHDPVEAIKSLTNGAGVDYAFEAVGLKQTAEQSFNCLARAGTATLVGMISETIELPGRAFLQEKKVLGSLMGSNRFRIDMPRYIEFVLQGRLNLEHMITRRGRLEDVNDAFRALRDAEGARTVLLFDAP